MKTVFSQKLHNDRKNIFENKIAKKNEYKRRNFVYTVCALNDKFCLGNRPKFYKTVTNFL